MERDNTPVVTRLVDEDGEDERGFTRRDSWNQDRDEDAAPGISLFANALQVWTMAQNKQVVTVHEAALSFNVRPEIIIQAVNYHAWMFLDGDLIEHDGE